MYSVLKVAGVIWGFAALFYLSGLTLLGRRNSADAVTALTLGLVADIALSMVCGNLQAGLFAQALLAMPSITVAYRQIQVLGSDRRRTILPVAAFLLLALGFALLCVTQPIHDWDARSIWFYHAKVIFHTQSIWAGGSWSEQANIYTHLNYPKLFPLLAAQVATIFGFWNEYVPKLAIALLALPILACYLHSIWSVSGTHWLRLATVLMLTCLYFGFDGAGFYLFNGYMDGWVALYAMSALLVLSRAMGEAKLDGQDYQRQKWQLAAAILAVLAQIKQEGLIIAALVASTVSMLILLRISRNPLRWPSIVWRAMGPHYLKLSLQVLFLLGPIVAWTVASRVQHLATGHYSGDLLGRMTSRLVNPDDRNWIWANIIMHNALILPSLALAALLVFTSIWRRKLISLGELLPLIIVGLYFVVIFFVYLGTSADLAWHMAASAGRVGLTPALCLAAFNILRISGTDGGDQPSPIKKT